MDENIMMDNYPFRVFLRDHGKQMERSWIGKTFLLLNNIAVPMDIDDEALDATLSSIDTISK